MNDEYEIEIYETSNGKMPYMEWENSLNTRERAIITERLARICQGNFGDCKSITNGLREIRVNFGPGYRIYYGVIGKQIILLLCGGDKSSQKKDIEKAKNYWNDAQKVKV